MKIFGIFSIISAMVFSLSASAAPPDLADFSKINLVGLQVLDKDGMDTFGYKVKPVTKTSPALVATLENESYSQVVSPIFELDEVSASKNIYVYIGKKTDGVFELVIARENKSGSFFVVDMDIYDVTKNELKMKHGPPDSVELKSGTRASGHLFP